MSTRIRSARPDAVIDRVSQGTVVFEAAVSALDDIEIARASHLPGWSRAHVVAHVARNSDALINLLDWARTGVETPMYTSTDQRAAEIEAGARLRPDVLRADVRAADARLADAIAALPDVCWEAQVRTARGRLVPVSEVAWMRAREVWVHAVDLGAGVDFDAIPHEICAALLDDIAAAFRTRPEPPSVALTAEDDQRGWLLGVADATDLVTVRGSIPSLAAYAAGRPVPGPVNTTSARPVPALPAWL